MGEELRNEVEVSLGGVERTLKATFIALRSIERATGKSIIQLVTEAQGISITDAVTVIHYGLRGNDDERFKTIEETGQAVMAAGLEQSVLAAVGFLMQALTGVSLGKPEAAAPAPQ